MINDLIVKGNLSDFSEKYNFTNFSEDDVFEHYCNFLIFQRFNSEIFDDIDFIKKINPDNGHNFGIDGIGFLMNNTFVFNEDNIEYFTNSSKNSQSINADIVFTQVKTSSKFESGEILKFIKSVKLFLDDSNDIQKLKDINAFNGLKKIFLNYETLKCVNKNNSPNCHLFFVTTGKNQQDSLLMNLIESEINELKEKFQFFKAIKLQLIGRDELIKYYQEYQNQVECKFEFKDRIDLGGINGVGKAFLGSVKATEYLKLIEDESHNFRRNIFYENVRDFKGELNKVNSDISDTLRNQDFKDKFILLNNGVTIVAKDIDTNFPGGIVKLSNYQVVNGCQTSNILFLNKDEITSEIIISVKLIECNDNDITSEITKGTNNQNPVAEEAFVALEKFPKLLQKFFNNASKDAPVRLYYERRAKEYDNIIPPINNSKIFHLHKLIRATIAMFIDQPHSCHRYPGELYKSTKSSLFGSDKKMFTINQSPYPYYTSCYLWYVIEDLFGKHVINKKYKTYKYHLLFSIKILCEKKQLKGFDRMSDAEKYCKSLLKQIWSQEIIEKLLKASCKAIDLAIINTPNIQTSMKPRSSEFTNILLDELKSQKPIT